VRLSDRPHSLSSRSTKPVLFVTGHAPSYRVGAFQSLAAREDVEFALFGGRLHHGGGATAKELPFPHLHVREHELYTLAASGRYRAVVCPTGGRIALPATWAGARRARLPLILWASLWAHPRTLAHAFGFLALRRLYRSADAIVTYGPHVSEYVRTRGARNVYEAPQSVDNGFWNSSNVKLPRDPIWANKSTVKFLFAGRPTREKGLGVLFEAWSMSGLQAPTAALVLVGAGSTPPWVPAGGAVAGASGATPANSTGPTEVGKTSTTPANSTGATAVGCWDSVVSFDPVSPTELRNFYAAADVLVVPSIPTPTFREPWGLVVNEAMNRSLPILASDAVGAAAGGLVRDGHNGLVVPAGDPIGLAAALRRLANDGDLRARLGNGGHADVSAYTHDAWAEGFSRALAHLGLSREAVR
jgi:glycosyltransferase involved in cell wall biosynthesis